MKDINKEIEKLNWNREPKGLYEPIGYTLEAGGKRLRPTLALLGAAVFGGKDEDVLPAALALEVFHNYTLLHDDVMDRSDVRRGRTTVWRKWDENTAILSGDQMMIESYGLLAGVPAEKLQKVLRLFVKMGTEICEGQQYDVDFESRNDVTIAEYMEMIRLKTSVLLATALQIGAYIAGANDEEQQALYTFGEQIGLAFQLQDDILDVYGDAATFGKPIGGDICCNKKTYMLLTALAKAEGETLELLDAWIRRTEFDRAEKIAAVTDIYTRLGVRADAEQMMRRCTDRALKALSLVPQNEYTDLLRQLADKLLNRNN